MDKEKVELQLKFTPNYKKYSILLNCYRVGGMKWNDVDGAIFHKIDLSKEDVLFALGVKQQIADLEAKLAEKEKFLERIMSGEYIPANIAEKSLKLSNQTVIAVLEEVKKLFEEKYAYDVEESDFAVIYETDIDEIINQQIKSLKGGKENV